MVWGGKIMTFFVFLCFQEEPPGKESVVTCPPSLFLHPIFLSYSTLVKIWVTVEPEACSLEMASEVMEPAADTGISQAQALNTDPRGHRSQQSCRGHRALRQERSISLVPLGAGGWGEAGVMSPASGSLQISRQNTITQKTKNRSCFIPLRPRHELPLAGAMFNAIDSLS